VWRWGGDAFLLKQSQGEPQDADILPSPRRRPEAGSLGWTQIFQSEQLPLLPAPESPRTTAEVFPGGGARLG
ncbi:unnamed protein product, partial [Polarella glacialis]